MPKVRLIMELNKQVITDNQYNQLSKDGKEKLRVWLINKGYDTDISIGIALKFLIDNKEKVNLWRLITVWVELGGDLIDVLWDYMVDVLEDHE